MTSRFQTVVWTLTAVAVGASAMLMVTQAWRAGAAPGDDDATYQPTAGCRLVDTRPPPLNIGPRSTPLGPDEIFDVAVHGSNGQCTGPLAIPNTAVGVALNVTVVGATRSSNVRIYPADLTTVPLLSNLNVTAGSPPTPNKVDVSLSPDGKIKVYNFAGQVNVVIDVVGIYTTSSLKELDARLDDTYTKSEVNALLPLATESIVLSGAAFSGSRDATRRTGADCMWASTAARASLGIPVGSTVTGLRANFVDTDGGSDVDVELFYLAPGGASALPIGSVESSGSTGFQQGVEGSVPTPILLESTGSMYLNMPTSSTSRQLCAIEVTYTKP